MPIFRRHIYIETTDRTARVELEDDFHRFGVDLTHDGSTVLSARGREIRTPWNTCRGAGAMLSRLEGLPLLANPTDFARQSNVFVHCTHQFEIAALAAANAARGVRQVRYEASVPYPIDRPTRVTLTRNSETVLEWTVTRNGGLDFDAPRGSNTARRLLHDVLVSPAPFEGRTLAGLLPWAREHFDAEAYEAITVLRRATGLSGGRSDDLDEDAERRKDNMFSGATRQRCFVFKPGNGPATHRQIGSTIDFSDTPERLLADQPEAAALLGV